MTSWSSASSLGANTARQAAIGSTFKADRQIQLHGYHISSNGTVGAWRSCLEARTRIGETEHRARSATVMRRWIRARNTRGIALDIDPLRARELWLKIRTTLDERC